MKFNTNATLVAIIYNVINFLFWLRISTMPNATSMVYIFIYPCFWIITLIIVSIMGFRNKAIWFSKSYKVSTIVALFFCTPFPFMWFKEGDVVVIIFPDHGTRYLGKMYNDDWLRDRGFLKDGKLTAGDIISKKDYQEIITIDCEKSVLEAINTIKSLNISQLPVTQKGMVIGKITESDILNSLLENPSIKSQPIKNITTAPFPFVDLNTSIDRISSLINKENIAVLVEDEGKIEIITQYDIINAISA
jgi:hypothetical protein